MTGAQATRIGDALSGRPSRVLQEGVEGFAAVGAAGIASGGLASIALHVFARGEDPLAPKPA